MEDNTNFEQLLNLNKQLTVVQRKEWEERLTAYIQYLLLHDFNKLVQLLYRVDVNEQKLRELLQRNPEKDAAIIMAVLLIQRQEEKIKTKSSFPYNNDIPDDEKW